jgi:hypothetical protein
MSVLLSSLPCDRLQVAGCPFRRSRLSDCELGGDPCLVLGREVVAEVTGLLWVGAAVAEDPRGSRPALGALVDRHQVDHLFRSLLACLWSLLACLWACLSRHEGGRHSGIVVVNDWSTCGRGGVDLSESWRAFFAGTGGRFRSPS